MNFARNYEKKIILGTYLVNETIFPSTQRPSVLNWRLSDLYSDSYAVDCSGLAVFDPRKCTLKQNCSPICTKAYKKVQDSFEFYSTWDIELWECPKAKHPCSFTNFFPPLSREKRKKTREKNLLWHFLKTTS